MVTNLKSRLPLVYLITDRHKLGPTGADLQAGRLVDFLEVAIASGIDMIQLRERDLSARDLVLLTRTAVECAGGFDCNVLVNDRADIAASCGAGVHLTTRSVRPAVVRRVFGDDLLMGVSTHNAAEVQEADDAGADFVVFGPVYETGTKKQYGATVGLGNLEEVSSRFKIPVLALGGINETNYRSTLTAGASGIAGISIFTESADMSALVQKVKGSVKSEE